MSWRVPPNPRLGGDGARGYRRSARIGGPNGASDRACAHATPRRPRGLSRDDLVPYRALRGGRLMSVTLHAPKESIVTKSTVTKLFVGSLIAIVAGVILLVIGLVVGYANGAFLMSGPDVRGIDGTPFAWSMVGLGVLGILAMLGGGIGQFV